MNLNDIARSTFPKNLASPRNNHIRSAGRQHMREVGALKNLQALPKTHWKKDKQPKGSHHRATRAGEQGEHVQPKIARHQTTNNSIHISS
jgi:hypothetical protein